MENENKAVALLAEQLATICGYSQQKVRQIKVAAALHDVGKNRISKQILNKVGKLTKQEFEEMKMHTIYGSDCLSSMQGALGKMVQGVALLHHEKWDGSGYWGYKTSSLPRYIGIVSICDTYCALTFERIYKPAWTLDEALVYITNQAGKQFCPELVNIFIPLIRDNNSVSGISKSKLSA